MNICLHKPTLKQPNVLWLLFFVQQGLDPTDYKIYDYRVFIRNKLIILSNSYFFPEIHALINDDLSAVDALILERLQSDVVLINQLGRYIISGGGKRIRPVVVLLAARASGATGDEAIQLAAVIEFIHTATLRPDFQTPH